MKTFVFPSTLSRRMNQVIPISSEEEDKAMGLGQSPGLIRNLLLGNKRLQKPA